MSMWGQAIHLNTNLAHDVLHNGRLGDEDDTKISHTVFARQLLDFHMKTLAYTQQISWLAESTTDK